MTGWPIQLTTDVSLISLILLAVLALLFFKQTGLQRRHRELKQELERLRNEFRAMNSGQLGMGREIKKVIQDVANVENLQQNQHEFQQGNNSKTYEQAGVLLSRGASIEEVVEACEIAPAEAELLAIVRNTAPSHKSSK